MSQLMRLWHLPSSVNTHSHRVGLDICVSVAPFVFFYTSCVRMAKALSRLSGCAGSPGPSLVAYVISTIISWAGSNSVFESSLIKKAWYGCDRETWKGFLLFSWYQHNISQALLLLVNKYLSWGTCIYKLKYMAYYIGIGISDMLVRRYI